VIFDLCVAVLRPSKVVGVCFADYFPRVDAPTLPALVIRGLIDALGFEGIDAPTASPWFDAPFP
jgi:hypothetical protein